MSGMSGDKITSDWDLLDRIRSRILSRGTPPPEALVTGIGDDCAVYRITDNRYGLFTADISIEGTHFLRERASLSDIAFKAMTGNLSDIAAMAGDPIMAFISLGLPSGVTDAEIDMLYDGFLEAATPFGTVVAGGDIARSESLVISIALYGEITGRPPVSRGGARPGDRIVLTGDTGRSLAGLDILLSGEQSLRTEFPSLSARHLRPSARVNEARSILELGPSAMIDISDGLLSDLRHICNASGTGFRLESGALPLHEELVKYSLRQGKDPLNIALTSGEEYELILVFPPSMVLPEAIGGCALTVIGEITGEGFILSGTDGDREVFPDGWDHFKNR